MNGIVVDLSRHPEVQYAVVWNGQLLPIRFATEAEAFQHLSDLNLQQRFDALRDAAA